MKVIATVVASLLLSVGLLVSPAAADEVPVETPPCATVVPELMDGPDAIADLIELRRTVVGLELHVDVLDAQRELDEKTMDRQWKTIWRQEATIKRLRARLAQR